MELPADFTLFLTPIAITGPLRTLMLIPLALTIAVVYKTIHCRHLRDVPIASLVLCATIVIGMFAVGGGLLLVYELLA